LPQFAPLVKLHKQPIAIRPIIPAPGWFTEQASRWVDEFLRPYLSHFRWICPSSLAAVRDLDYDVLSVHAAFISLDVSSMYTNMDMNSVIRNIRQYCCNHIASSALSSRDQAKANERVELCCRLLRFICHNNYFGFNQTIYQQGQGVAMGTPCAPTVADLAMAISVDTPFLTQRTGVLSLTGIDVKHYLRYRDDVLLVLQMLTPVDISEVCSHVLRHLNQLDPISFSLERTGAGDDVHFCDLRLRFEVFATTITQTSMKRIRLSSYEKPQNLHLYSCPDSYYPNAYKFNWISGENIRLIRNSSSRADYEESVQSFKSFLLRREFPESRILSQLSKVAYAERSRYLYGRNSDRSPAPSPTRVFVHNLPGRHIVSRRLNAAYDRLDHTTSSDNSLQIVTYRGFNLSAVTRRLTKAVLSPS
jgi:hypothetical protein